MKIKHETDILIILKEIQRLAKVIENCSLVDPESFLADKAILIRTQARLAANQERKDLLKDWDN